MIQMLFSLRFRSQLHRTRAEEVSSLEETVIKAAQAVGGSIKQERRFFSVSFDENVTGFWLDMVILIEAVDRALKKIEQYLFGYTCVFCRDLNSEDAEQLCRILSLKSGIRCDPQVYPALSPYMVFEECGARSPEEPVIEAASRRYPRLEGLKDFTGALPLTLFPFREKIRQTMAQEEEQKNTLFYGPEFIGKRDGLYFFCASFSGETPPLAVHFGTGGQGPACYVDALTPEIYSFIQNNSSPELKERLTALDAPGALIFQERLGDEFPVDILESARWFFRELLDLYIAAAGTRRGPPVLVLENIHRADTMTVRLFMDVFASLPNAAELLIFGTYGAQEGRSAAVKEEFRIWNQVFSRIVQFDVTALPHREPPDLPLDLWELACVFSLLGRYFPGTLFRQLFEEDGKNPAMLSLALRVLAFRGIVDFPWDPRPRIPGFDLRAPEVLGDRIEKVHLLVRRRLLDWVCVNEKIRPCFALLRALSELGGDAEDELVLRAIRGDLIRGTYGSIEAAIRDNYFDSIVRPHRGLVLRYIYRTLQALIYGDGAKILEAFKEPPSAVSTGVRTLAPEYQVQILMDLTAYYLGIRDIPTAAGRIKEALIISQKQKPSAARVYRLFSLVELSKQQINDALEYASFAVDQAERLKRQEELAAAVYYAAVTQFLFGNILRAGQCAQQAETAALVSGQSEWADRARFLRGRLLFETGLYQDALEIFRGLSRQQGEGTPAEYKNQLISAWIYRALAFLGEPLPPVPPNAAGDILFFELEAACLAENYQGTLALTGRLREFAANEDNFVYIEQPDWRSGFAQCEWLIRKPGDFWDRLCTAYEALALSHLAPGGTAALEAANRLRLSMREGMSPDTDPNDVFYFYTYFHALRESNSSSSDTSTAISKAFKRLQHRASRIDDMETRGFFLSLPHWNGKLNQAAREYKLL